MAGGRGSTVPRRALGRHLLALRQKAKLKVNDVAAKMDWSPPTLWRIETGRKAVRTVDVELLCQLYGADDETRAGLVELARETKARDWWRVYGDAIPSWLDLFLGLEQAAATVRAFDYHFVPGIVQTEQYARSIFEADRNVPAKDVSKLVKARMDRQAILTREEDPHQYDLVIDEDVLRRSLVARDVMAEQLEHLIKVSEMPNVTLRVVPFAAGPHPGIWSGAFFIMTFPPAATSKFFQEPETVYAEAFAVGHYFDKPEDVERYVDTFDALTRTSLDEEATRDLIQQLRTSL
ncbi:MAG TPA: helix-turn-helix transcriptional regulator [Micromonosporaceae bacterium]